jgi:hypothetical protein
MVSQPEAVTEVILDALAATSEGTTWSELILETYLDE